MTFESDLTSNSAFSHAQIQAQETPNANVTEEDFAILVQRIKAPDKFKGIIQSQWVERSKVVDPYQRPFINLSLTRSVAFPLTRSALYYCSDNTVTWDETDLPLITGKTPSEIIAAPLKSKIAVIGDASQIFELNGARSPGPLIFRWSGSALWVIKETETIGTNSTVIWKVIPMLLQPISTSTGTATPAIAERTIYTTSTALTPQNRDLILVDGVLNSSLKP
jgi:hypothetical protein